MCRFLVYKGRPILMAELLTRPNHSLIKQSYAAELRSEPLNGDGFGVGWYAPEIDPQPCLFTSVTPAWSNQNLRHLAEKVRAPCFFAHVRAASPGMRVSDVNCHPFQSGRLLWMHNGAVAGFDRIRRRLRESLSDARYNFIQGTTDSEHVFALFLDRLGDPQADHSAADLRRGLVETIAQLEGWVRAAGVAGPSHYNFAVSDGRSVIASRYVSDPGLRPASLYFSAGVKFECQQGVCRMIQSGRHEHAVIITSEPLTDIEEDWTPVAANHLIEVTPELEVLTAAI